MDDTSPATLLAGKVAVVTGAGRGVGRGVALALARAGAALVVNDLGVALSGAVTDETPAETVVKEIQAFGGRALVDRGNVADAAAAGALIEAARSAFGRVDIVVNNAGNLRDAIFHRMTEEEFDSVIAVHLKGTFNVSRAAAPHFKGQGSGAFIRINVDFGSRRQFRAGQLLCGEAGNRGAIQGDRARHAEVRRAIQRGGALRLDPHGELDT